MTRRALNSKITFKIEPVLWTFCGKPSHGILGLGNLEFHDDGRLQQYSKCCHPDGLSLSDVVIVRIEKRKDEEGSA